MSDWVWVPDNDWRVPSLYAMCRMRACDKAPVADLNRRARLAKSGTTVDRWYAYCGDHLYGRRVQDGVVEVLVHPDSPAAKRGYV